MNYPQAVKKFYATLTQEERREYVKLFKEGKTNLIDFVTEIEQKNQAKLDAEEDRKQAKAKKAVEETVARRTRKKDELLDSISEKLTDISLDEAFHKRIIKFLSDACGNESTQTVVICLVRLGQKEWQVTSLTSPNKDRRVVINIGTEKES